MILGNRFAALIWMASCGVTIAYNRGCDFNGMDLDSVVEKVLGLLPPYHAPDDREFRTAFSGLKTGTLNVTGLDNIHRYGPIQPYCVNGNRLISLDVIAPSSVVMSLPWRACSGQEGTLNMRTGLSRFTLVFRVEAAASNEAPILAYEGPIIPVYILEPHMYIDGAGRGVSAASMIVSKLVPAFTEEVWNDYFFVYFRGALRQALRDAFEKQ
ncbi:hypothetical protein HPB50_027078 [Hyalomma asiaticum]|uniref:Uncharacterized protein n=1 Tax=Hyalomma asiaticum TaxID=266040 RepID=A0ACB7RZ77_HYAAI|nr:hypothetical protein HPB50_027078 [Hyalomma asiaticum]